MVIPREQRYSTKNGSGLDSLGHFLAFLLLFASSRCCFRRVDFVTAPFLLNRLNYQMVIRLLGSIYILSVGLTSKASYHSAKFLG